MKKSLYDYCTECGNELLLQQWHPVRNEILTPQGVAAYSQKKVWWKCEKGHEWSARVSSRTSAGAGCPVCACRRVQPGYNDLASVRPDLVCQWHPKKNGTLTPERVVPGTRRKVWWQCEEGHEWQASLASRTQSGTGCPVCSGKLAVSGENDLRSLHPELASQWHPRRNGTLTPDRVVAHSNRKVWWCCEKGHEWQAAVFSRTEQLTGCPYCTGRKVLAGFNDLATVVPDVAAQWHPVSNGVLTPQQVTAGSQKKVWWKCPEGHVWKAAIYSRTRKKQTGCPVCAGQIREVKRLRYGAILAEEALRVGLRSG